MQSMRGFWSYLEHALSRYLFPPLDLAFKEIKNEKL